MYVCLCNRVTDRELIEAAAAFASESETGAFGSFAERVANQLGVGLGCGTCREFALDLVERAATRRSMVVLPDCVVDSPGLGVPSAERCRPAFQRAAPCGEEAAASRGD
ncbi:MAG: (2Fe-2S)-binding protein [Thiotrichales bacterium]|nr:(2Fe-2S)-binding protein [Thiotrichales bacterium]